ncbi:exosome complex exonuclease, putative [Eimeria mitis]|uniref:Exosome complex exonuclease, putative n=1 Tax=Eimeria mitis TaxID=44415 RepID=U6JTQ7_9EIME|nr:exosome complex exonuclease, putative [Eimeria mitis]CDJ28171.1 exosome complex exonuclease, putative [Eimeria mitis]
MSWISLLSVSSVSCFLRISAGKPFPIDTVPILITAAQIGDTYLWDLTEVEATCGDSFLVAAFLPSGACVGLQKFGHVLADCRTLQTTLATSQRLSREVLEDLQRQSEIKNPSMRGNLDSFFALASL